MSRDRDRPRYSWVDIRLVTMYPVATARRSASAAERVSSTPVCKPLPQADPARRVWRRCGGSAAGSVPRPDVPARALPARPGSVPVLRCHAIGHPIHAGDRVQHPVMTLGQPSSLFPHHLRELPAITQGAQAMSLARVQNFSISLDGFGTGEGQSADAHFGHAGDRLHEWMFTTRWWQPGGRGGIDDAFARLFTPGIGAEIMGAGKFGHPGWHEDPEWKGAWGPNPPFHTPVFVLTHHTRAPIEMEG